MKFRLLPIITVWILPLLAIPSNGADVPPTTRQRTVRPVALPTNTPVIYSSDVSDYAVYGYSSWQWGPGEDEG
jgi:hypothetical protein